MQERQPNLALMGAVRRLQRPKCSYALRPDDLAPSRSQDASRSPPPPAESPCRTGCVSVPGLVSHTHKLDIHKKSLDRRPLPAQPQAAKGIEISRTQVVKQRLHRGCPKDAIDAAAQMEQQPTVNIAGVEVPIRGLPEKDPVQGTSKKPPPKKQVLFCGYCEQACRRVLRCSKCKSVAYCGIDCQRKAWPNHKKRCVPPRHTKSLCACCGALAEVANCDALVAVGASTPCRVCGETGTGDPVQEHVRLRELLKRKPTGPHASLARALVGKYALDRYREKPEREDDDPERLLALETLTLSARAGVAAAAAALGQLHYYDALDAQEAFDILCKASGNDAGVAPRIPDHLNLARGWYKEALESRGEYRLSDAERDRVLRLPHVQNIVGVGQGTVAVSNS